MVAILGMMTTMVAQQSVIPVVRVKAASKGQKPATRSAIADRAMCDEAGNVYSLPPNVDVFEASIQEITPNAQLASRFPAEANTFFVRGQDVYTLVWLKGGGLYVTEFGQDGQLDGRTKLELPFFVKILHLAVFKSGEYLVAGLTETTSENAPHLSTPFTAVFATDGRLVKKIYEPEDEDARQRAEGEDPQYFMCCSGNEFTGWNADVTFGSDGNVYLLHGFANFATRTLPLLIYVISPKGDVVRKLQIDPGNPELIPSSIKFHAGHLAVGFHWLNDVPQSLIKVIDVEGNSISDYIVEESADDADPILACYNSEGFTLVPRRAGSTPYLLTAKQP
jgi:hypothetical protein